jgi:predicted nucleic acid-binding protein
MALSEKRGRLGGRAAPLKIAVVDASVCTALLKADEIHHDACRRWFEEAIFASREIFAPSILVAEVAAALSRGLGAPDLAHKAVTIFPKARSSNFSP